MDNQLLRRTSNLLTMSLLLKCMVFSMLLNVSFVFPVFGGDTAQSSAPFKLTDAGQNGAFSIGTASAENVYETVDGRDISKISFSVPHNTAAGVWFKDLPEGISKGAAYIVDFGIQCENEELSSKCSYKIELKGSDEVQIIPFICSSSWIYIQELIDWDKIGDLEEVVIVVEHAAGQESVSNVLCVDMHFKALGMAQKIASSVIAKLGAVVLSSFVLALGGVLLTNQLKSRSESEAILPEEQAKTADSGFLQHLLWGLLTALIAVVIFQIYSMGTVNRLDAGWGFLWVGLGGVIVIGLLKFLITARCITAVEIFWSMFITGLFASTSSSSVLLQAPSTWTEILYINKLTAAVACLIYFLANAYTLNSQGRLFRTVSSLFIAVIPYLFGWLLLVESPAFLQTLSTALSGGALEGRPEFLKWMGRVIVLFVFNEAITNGISYSITRKVVRSFAAHLLIALISIWVVSSPIIADLGSSASVAALPAIAVFFVSIITTIFAHGGLWAEVYLLTGMIMDGMRNTEPSRSSMWMHATTGVRKGMVYSGVFIGLLYGLGMFAKVDISQWLLSNLQLVTIMIFSTLVFPLIKTIIETFDGSYAFFNRVGYSYRNIVLYARGAVVGLGMAVGLSQGMIEMEMSSRILFGLIVGIFASAGISVLRDLVYQKRGKGQLQTWRLYFTDALLGGFIGSAVAFYLDASQVPVVIEKIQSYISTGVAPKQYDVRPLLNNWGYIDLGQYTGGVKLFFTEALAGVINWSVAAWLFAINRAFLTALFQRDKAPIQQLISKQGFTYLIEHTIQVLRWGLWMSPIINTFLRMMGEATWYNQDGAIRTIVTTFQSIAMGSEEFQAWSLKLFVYVLAYDLFRVVIWLDHMGLRVATLVNLSFLGMDKLDEKCARFIGRASGFRYIPEGVKRFTTWAPLLIPFYIPQGRAWDEAWNRSQEIIAARGPGLTGLVQSMSIAEKGLWGGLLVVVCTVAAFVVRSIAAHASSKRETKCELANSRYSVSVNNNGEAHSILIQSGCDVSRRSYESIDPSGRVLYIVDESQEPTDPARTWPVIGNYPRKCYPASQVEKTEASIQVQNSNNDIITTVDISLPDFDNAIEIWTVTLENKSDTQRSVKVVPYLEWVLNKADDDRGHTQYHRLFPVMEYAGDANAVLAWQKNTQLMGILASDIEPEGFLTSRMDFIGRAQSIWSPRALDTLAFSESKDTQAYPTFDPIGSLLVGVSLNAGEVKQVRFLVGCARDKQEAFDLLGRYLHDKSLPKPSGEQPQMMPVSIGHGEILPGTPQPYSTFIENGDKLLIHTPYTPRPYDHALSNGAGHYITVTNRGLHTSSNGNSQQNRLTTDWQDTVTRELSSEALYLYDIEDHQWYSPTYHPLNDSQAEYETEFGVDGTAVFRMKRDTLSTELTVFVPPEEPIGVYHLTIRNESDQVRRLRVAPYFQMVLSGFPEASGPLQVRYQRKMNTLFYRNPRNSVCPGYAFVSMSQPAETVETKRGRFFGKDCPLSNPAMVETGQPDKQNSDDTKPIAAMVSSIEIPARSEQTVVVILGHTSTKKQAAEIIKKYRIVDNGTQSLAETRQWWQSLMQTVSVETNKTEFDYLQNWLKYQAVTERIWARRGFYQTSGAFGFRDQLQDTVNLIWMDPSLARKQLVLHASQQFVEGDVLHWFHWTPDGRTGFANRSWASDNLLWLVWGVVEYIRMTGDESILEEMATYLKSELPMEPLPQGKHGLATLYFRSTESDSVYHHCKKSIDLVLDKRMGKSGLPLILTGDWNDGLDEIGSEGKGESVWLAFFLYSMMNDFLGIIEKREGPEKKACYAGKMEMLKESIEKTWRGDRYLRAIHDDGTEIGVKGSGIWEIDALTVAWAIISGVNYERGKIAFQTAVNELENDTTILLGTPPLREDMTPYLGRSSKYPEGVRENGMYCHGDQWLIKAARILAEQAESKGNDKAASEYREAAYRLWCKITPVAHVTPEEIERYGGQPNKQAADMLTTYDNGRMIWNGYTGAAGWLLRQAFEGVVGVNLLNNKMIIPKDLQTPRGELQVQSISRCVEKSPLYNGRQLQNSEQHITAEKQ